MISSGGARRQDRAPKPLFQAWPELSRSLGRTDSVLLGLDFDGTLAAPARLPAYSRLAARTRKLLARFASRHGFQIVVISGRGLADLRRRVSVPGIHYAGNHGLEIAGPGLRFLHPGARAAARKLRPVARAVARAVGGLRGVHLEDKRYSLSLHYTDARAVDRPLFEAAVSKALAGRRRGFELLRGKRVFEVRPRLRWQKGDALSLLLAHTRRRLPIFVGDDSVDEHAFRAARRAGGFGIRVGTGRPTQATHFLTRQARVPLLLERLLTLRGPAGQGAA